MIKDLIGRGIGFNPGSVKFIPTLGLSPNPVALSVPVTTIVSGLVSKELSVRGEV